MKTKPLPRWHVGVRGALVGCLFGLAPMLVAQDLPTDGLMARWDFEEGSGPTAHDTSGNGNDGTLDNYVDDSQWVPGRFGGGLAFTGSTDNRLIVPDAASIGADLVNGFTVAVWLKSNVDLPAGGSGAAVLEKGNSYFLLQGVASGGMNLLLKQSGNKTVPLGESLAAGRWYHIAGVFDGSEARIYLDGQLKGSLPVTAPIDDPALPLVIGGDDAGRTFNGTLDQVALWNRPLTEPEILQAAARVGPPKIETQPAGMDLFVGGTAIFNVTAIGEEPLRYLWYKGDEPLRSETEATLVIEYVTAADAGDYYVVVTNDQGEVSSDRATLTVQPVAGLETARVLYLPLDETSGLSAADASGNGNDGTLTGYLDNTSHWGPGAVDGSLDFQGDAVTPNVGTTANVADSASLDSLTHEATFSFWLKLGGWGVLEDVGTYQRSASYVLRKGDHFGIRAINDPGSVVETLVVRSDRGADNGSVPRHGFEVNAPQGAVALDEWQHWTVLYRNHTVSFYLNGFRVGDPAPGVLGSPDDAPLVIGGYDDLFTLVNTSMLKGRLDEVGIWSRPLSEAEILELAGQDVSGPPAIAKQPAAQKRIEGTTAFFEVFVTGKRPVSYQWLKDGQPIEGATGSTLSVTRLKPGDAGEYSVQVTNSEGSVTSEAATLVVEALDAVTSGLVAYYPFDDGPGSVLTDASGNGLDGEVMNMDDASRVAGQINGAFQFDGADDYVTVPHNDLLNLGSEATVSVWLNIDGLSDGSDFDRVFRKATTFDFVLLNNGVIRVHGIGKTPYPTPPDSWEIGAWTHYAYVAKNGTIQWYRNGEPLGDALPGRLGELNTDPLTIANYQSPPGNISRPYMGRMDDLGIWQRALNPTEILGIYVNGLAGKPLNQEFEPLNIQAIRAQGGVVEVDYFSPFSDRPTQLETKPALDGAPWTVADATIVDRGQGNFTATVTVADASTAFFRVAAVPPPPLFFDDFESDVPGWTHGGGGDNWARGVPTTGPTAAFSPENVYATGLDENLQPFTDAWLRTPPIDLSAVSSAKLTFAEWLNVDFIDGIAPEDQIHKVTIEVLDATTLTPLTAQPVYVNSGNSGGWQMREVRLVGGAVGAEVVIEFHIVTDNFNLLEGWYLDDVTVTAN